MTSRPRLRVAEVIDRFEKRFAERYPQLYTPSHRRVLRDLAACRTAHLGGHLERCNACGFARISYNSCRNRHCPSCLGTARADWLNRQEADVLPVPYFHVVFTLPEPLRDLALQNKPVIYGILFRAVSETLRQVARDPQHLGAEIGLLAVLHTWGQNLTHHPHLHCVLPAGGLACDGSRWIPCRRSGNGKLFLASVRVLSKLFRGKFLHYLRAARRRQRLKYHGSLRDLESEPAWEAFLNGLVRQDWVVYCKRPFGGPRQVLRYLARYTHRVAISDHRLQEVTPRTVTFSYKDYRDQSTTKSLTITGEEFLRRFLLHVLPSGFMRIRYYGFLANGVRTEKLQLIRGRLTGSCSSHTIATEADPSSSWEPPVAQHPTAGRCPECQQGTMQRLQEFPGRWFVTSSHQHRGPPGGTS
jgi:hypothetical protein